MKTPDLLYAVVSDIHGNYPALQQVDADARAQAQRLGCELRFICLGDVVDYGPFPNECMDWVVQTGPHITLQGNHDAEAIRPPLAETKRVGMQWFPITYWTRCTLAATHRLVVEQWRGTATGNNGLGEFLFFHGDPTGGDDYIRECSAAKRYFPYLHSGRRYGLFGHTHFQTLFVKDATVVGCDGRFAQPEASLSDSSYSATVNTWMPWPQRPALVNPGSVGQPRHHTAQDDALHDKRACYLLLRRRGEGWEMQWRRVEYDYQATVTALGRLTWPETTQRSGKGNDILKHSGDPASAPSLSNEQFEAEKARFSSVIGGLVDHLLQRNASNA